MDAKFVQRGECIDFRPDRDIAAGEVVVLGSLVGVAKIDVKAGELGELALTGVYEMPRSPQYGFIGCCRVAWSESRRAVVNPSLAGSVPIGHNVANTKAGESAILVRLYQGMKTS